MWGWGDLYISCFFILHTQKYIIYNIFPLAFLILTFRGHLFMFGELVVPFGMHLWNIPCFLAAIGVKVKPLDCDWEHGQHLMARGLVWLIWSVLLKAVQSCQPSLSTAVIVCGFNTEFHFTESRERLLPLQNNNTRLCEIREKEEDQHRKQWKNQRTGFKKYIYIIYSTRTSTDGMCATANLQGCLLFCLFKCLSKTRNKNRGFYTTWSLMQHPMYPKHV